MARARFDPIRYANSLLVTHASKPRNTGSMRRQIVTFRVIDQFYDLLLAQGCRALGFYCFIYIVERDSVSDRELTVRSRGILKGIHESCLYASASSGTARPFSRNRSTLL